MSPIRYQKIVRYSAIYDIAVTTLFAFPVIAAYKIGFFDQLQVHFQLGGAFPEFEPLHLMFVNLMGVLVTVWSVLRVIKPELVYGVMDAICRLFFSGIMAYYLFAAEVSDLVLLFLIPEFAWCVVQLVGYWQLMRLKKIVPFRQYFQLTS